MEFYYASIFAKSSRLKSFNSQRDGILPALSFFVSASYFCFNSQRDGILRRSAIPKRFRVLFQFPTGWNSTSSQNSRLLLLRVSIPNGMEFYATKLLTKIVSLVFQFPTGWNSTRYAHGDDEREREVSIPNGMEFYDFPSFSPLKISSFNSQRDGILQL